MPAKRKAGATPAARVAALKKGKKAQALPNDDDFILDSDDEKRKKKVESDDENSEDAETAEEKRLRLAKDYISRIQAHMDAEGEDDRRGVTGGSDEEGDGEGEDGAGPSGRARLGAALKQDAAETMGRVQRKLAGAVVLPEYALRSGLGAKSVAAGDEEDEEGEGDAMDEDGLAPSTSTPAASGAAGGVAKKGHRLAATGLALLPDESAAFTVSKDGSLLKWDMETCTKTRLYRPGEKGKGASASTSEPAPAAGAEAGSGAAAGGGHAPWVTPRARATSKVSLTAVAVSSDGALLAVGGGDRKVHLFDARSGSFIQSFPGHRDAVTALAFREGTHTLLSGSLDRTVKLWSCDDRAYMETLFGHQAEVLGLDMLRAERAVSVAADRSCRVWKLPEESQLIFRYHGGPGSAPTVDCCRYVTGTDWLTGSSDGVVALWTQMKRKPLAQVRGAHGAAAPGAVIPSGVAPDVAGWVQSVGVCRGSDLVASGAGDGMIRLWSVAQSKAGGVGGLTALGGLPARGFVNGLAIGRSGRVVAAAVGQEPRLGRWGRDGGARNGLLLHRLEASSA